MTSTTLWSKTHLHRATSAAQAPEATSSRYSISTKWETGLPSATSRILRCQLPAAAGTALDLNTSVRPVTSATLPRRDRVGASSVVWVTTRSLVIEVHDDQLQATPVLVPLDILEDRLDVPVLGLGVLQVGKLDR